MDTEDGSEFAAGRNAVARAEIASVYQRAKLVAQLDIERNVTFGLEMYGQHCLSQKANCSRYWTGARANLSCRVFWRNLAQGSRAAMLLIFVRIRIQGGNRHGVGFGVFGLLPRPEWQGAELREIALVALVDCGQR